MKCAINIRETSNKNTSNGLRHQEDLNNNYIREKNWSIYSSYVDIGSGTSHQENFQKMIENVQNKKFDAMIATDVSRLRSHNQRGLSQRDNLV